MLYAKMPPQRSSVPSTIATSLPGCVFCARKRCSRNEAKQNCWLLEQMRKSTPIPHAKKKNRRQNIAAFYKQRAQTCKWFFGTGVMSCQTDYLQWLPVHSVGCPQKWLSRQCSLKCLNLHYFQSYPRTARHDILFSSKGFFGNLPLNVLWNNSSKKRKNKYGQTQWVPSYKIPH